jgi:hypothetical protein
MTTAGTSSFNLDLNNIVEEAFERCGKELRTGYDLRTARRSLNLLTVEWSNRGVNLWTIENGEIPLIANQVSYELPIDTIDLLEHVTRTGTGTSQADLTITRISVSTYATIPNKLATGRPIQVWVDRQSGATYPPGGRPNGTNTTTGVDHPKIYVWPAPDQGSISSPYYTFVYWRMRRIQDAGNGITTQDIPFRFLNCMIAGLAYYLAIKVAPDRVAVLKEQYDEQWRFASEEDRDKAAVRFVPRRMFIE